jgi:hypothetical protein
VAKRLLMSRCDSLFEHFDKFIGGYAVDCGIIGVTANAQNGRYFKKTLKTEDFILAKVEQITFLVTVVHEG